ncbi:tryptophan halogenase family protein [Psychrobium sp. 1_MG-2023]|uniref:tryptophan halogenase family protein n=1 Tax=Psychrobium sp. 1_MG-2023 TaxID=3062624 RepID=UPI000C32F10D|nr:tryptophan halogenase family protein [Psychrobium sp. 1_MG-2023]MDP2559532.1 tryptophan 7-halogenase [Psychrobium sp. 1_MG-2023]PKF59372.1 tryptophan 7-halogenase [Alteromonadales bacterium alter-6D02]
MAENTNRTIKKVVIVGGGTAGWLAANHLGKQLINEHSGVEVCLIESPNIPTIGVGEGTVPLMRQTLQELGISETEFIRECDVTFKQGIKFVDWVDNPVANKPSYYHHVFDYPNITELDLTPYWLDGLAGDKSYADALSIQGAVCDAGLAPKLITTPEYQGLTAYAYHLDAGKFAAILTKNATKKLGVKHIFADVLKVNVAESGDITSVTTDSAGEIAADIFVDCTGFKALLIGEALGSKFISKQNTLFADHALAIQVPYDEPAAPIPSYTISTAQQAGWIWDIGLNERRGIGHVYSSAHTSHEQAEQDLRQYIGPAAEGIDARLIPMNIGYRELFWKNNCVAIGLSQGFVEPLEATGLLVFDATSKMLATQFPAKHDDIATVAKQFNRNVQATWDNVISFVKMHYCLSKRDDSAFWLDNRDKNSIPDTLLEQLELWRNYVPTQYDFSNRFDIFNRENFLYVMYGMHYPTQIDAIKSRFQEDEVAKQHFKMMAQRTQGALANLPLHRELLLKIARYGLQKR